MNIIVKLFLCIAVQGLYQGTHGQQRNFFFPQNIEALLGSCVEIPCTYTHFVLQPNIVWYMYDSSEYLEIVNNRGSSGIINRYKGRTSLVRNGRDSCTLKISNLTRYDGNKYYTVTDGNWLIDQFVDQQRRIQLLIKDFEGQPQLSDLGNIMEGNLTVITCSAEHTCASSPPTLKWNKAGLLMVGNKNLLNGQWKVISKLTYNASYEDHGKQIMCTATYPNGQSYMTQDILDIEYAPKGVHIVSSKTKDDYIELKCTFLSSRPNVTGYIWFIDDIIIHNYTKQILKLENLQTNSGKYYCVAHNKVGLTNSSSLQINITDKRVRIVKTEVKLGFIDLIEKEIAQSGTLQILIILAAIIFLIMAIILLYFCIRKRKCCITSKGNNNNQDTQSSDAVYTELMKRETSSEYAQLKLEKHPLVPEKRMAINRNLEYENLGEQI